MNPISKATAAIIHPVRTSVEVATAGVRTTARVLGWAVERAGGDATPQPASNPVVVPTATRQEVVVPPAPPAQSRDDRSVVEPVAPATKTAAAEKTAAKKTPAKKAPAKKAPAKKTAAKKAPSKKAPSKKAAVLAPALGLSEAEVVAQATDEPLLDTATAKAVAAETETLRRASDVDKG